MIIFMRTTLVIDDHVVRAAKRRALEAGMTLSELTTMALREELRKGTASRPQADFSMPAYGSGHKRAYSPEEIAELRDEGR